MGMVLFFLNNSPGWLAILSSLFYIVFFSLGLGPTPWLMMGELFPQQIRAPASAIASALNWTCSFFITQTISDLKAAFTFSGVFLFYGVVLLLGAMYVAIKVPETKGKSLAQVQQMLGGGDVGDADKKVPLITAGDDVMGA